MCFDDISYVQPNIHPVPYVTANEENTTTLVKALWINGSEEESVKVLFNITDDSLKM